MKRDCLEDFLFALEAVATLTLVSQYAAPVVVIATSAAAVDNRDTASWIQEL